jgi:integral membrane sensor domain MASE1
LRAYWKLPRDRQYSTLLFGVVEALNGQLARPAARQWLITLAGAGGIGILYFFAALAGLALRSQPSDVAVFWPASGVAVGILIVFGKRAVPAAVLGVVVGTVAANLMSDRSIWTALFKGFCNAGEALMVAWLLERWFGWPFTFGDLRRALGFVVAACLGAVVSGLGGAATITLLHTPAPYWDVWRAWFLSNAVGIMVVAPLVIEGGQVWRELPSRVGSVEGVGVLALVAFISLHAIDHPTGSWLSFDPDAIVLPLL